MRARPNARSRSPAARTARSSGCAARRYVDIGAYMRTNGVVGARNVAQFISGPYRIPNIAGRCRRSTDQQDAGRHLSRARPVRGRFLSRAAVRHRGDGSRHRPGRVPPPQSRGDSGDALSARHDHAVRGEGRSSTAATTRRRSIAASDGIRLGRESHARRQADRRALSRHWRSAASSRAAPPARAKSARLALETDGTVSVYVGSSAVGQGLETVFAQIAADALEMPMERIRGVFMARPAM